MKKILTVCLAMLPSYCMADIATSTTDAFEGATIVSTNSTNINGGFGVNGLFTGASAEIEGVTNTIFPDVGANNFNFVNFSIASAVELDAIRLTAASDGPSNSSRALNRFRFLADTDNDGTFETLLVDLDVNPDYSLQENNVASAANELDLTFDFANVVANQFRAEFFEDGSGTFDGVRIQEIDAFTVVAVPEPASAAILLPIFALTALRRRKQG